MYLAEAIKEKNFISEKVCGLYNRVKDLSVSTDDKDIKLNKQLIETKIGELENLYKEFQKYSIIISRAKVSAVIKLNDDEFSIADAENILESMGVKLNHYEELLSNIQRFRYNSQIFICVDEEFLYERIRNIRSDIKTIENSIARASWTVEV